MQQYIPYDANKHLWVCYGLMSVTEHPSVSHLELIQYRSVFRLAYTALG